MTFYGLNNLITAWNELVMNAVPPVVHMHPDTAASYLKWYNDHNTDFQIESAKFKGVDIELNSSLEPQIALVIRRDGLTRKVSVEFK